MTTSNPNQHVVDYLRYYTDEARNFDYAVMLDAPWGAGKTHLIKSFLAQSETEHLYVSLYGVTSAAQIDDELFRQMHPMLGSKGMRLAGRIAKGLVKGALKIDLGHGGHGSLDVNVPGIDVKEFFSGPKSRLIVFDDLERSGMKISDVLGYVNAFVEQEGVKVIIVANAAEVVKVEPRFREICEKLVGQAMFVKANVAAALPAFMELIIDNEVRQLLVAQRDEILNVHSQSGTNNLRILKQSLWDFERITQHLTADQRDKPMALRALLRQILSMAMDIKCGRLAATDIGDLGAGATKRLLARYEDGTPATPADEFEDRYAISSTEWIIPPEDLGAFLTEGNVDSDKIRHFFAVSPLFAQPSTIPAWRRAWYGYSSDDDVYEAAIAEMEQDFANGVYVDQHVLYHVFGIRLTAVEVGALPINRKKVVEDGKAYIEGLAGKGLLTSALTEELGTGDFGAYDGLIYHELETAEFRELVDYYVAAAHRATQAGYGDVARGVLTRGVSDPEAAFAALSDGSGNEGSIYCVPVLAAIPATEFVEILLGYDAAAQIKFIKSLKRRYKWPSLQDDLREEIVWLVREVRPLLAQALATVKLMTRQRLGHFIKEVIDPLLAKERDGSEDG